MTIKLIVVVFVAVFSVFSSAKMAVVDRVAALVDKDVVLESEVVRRTNSVISQIKARKQTVPDLEALRKQILDRLIIESLQVQMAKRAGVRVSDAELDTTLDRIAKDNGLSIEKFREQAVADGTPWAVFREDIRREIMISRVRSGMVQRRIKISDKEVDNLLAQINKEGLSRTQYMLEHILLALPESASPELVTELSEKAQRLVNELRAGANFQEYAITYSAGENALNGGVLGWRNATQLPSLFASVVKNMKVGEVSEPLRSGSGLHILHLVDSKGGFKTQEVVQTHVRHILISPSAILDNKAALEKIQRIRQRIIDGEDFAKLAIEFSDDKASGALGGDLKWTSPGAFVAEFTNMMNSLAPNQLSKPVKTQFGWHIMEVLGRRNQDQTESKKRERAYLLLQRRKFEEEALIWVSQLKDEAYIKIIDDN